jgi:UDP-N-acetyl-D-glucosamine dehydrogenase
MYYKNLKKKIVNKDATIAVVGLGYVGLPLLIQFYRKGFSCIGIDRDKSKINSLSKDKLKNYYFKSIFKKKNKHSVKSLKKIKFSYKYSLINKADCIIMCLPTPITKLKKPDLSYITSSLTSMGPYLKKGQLISLESTVSPGTTEKILGKYLINKKKFIISDNFFLVYSPERENPVIENLKQKFNFYNTPKICSGFSNKCAQVGFLLYSRAIKTVVKTHSLKNAEMAKMIENVYRSVNIGLVNELKMLSDKMNINIHEVLNLADTKPFGFTKFKPGPGIGGHCIPIDPYYLIWEAEQKNFKVDFIKKAVEINENITDWCLDKIEKIIRDQKIQIKNEKILILGAAYKANIDDLRESPSLKFFQYFKKHKIKFDYCDPLIPYIKKFKKSSIKLDYKIFNKYALVLILTDHSFFDKEMIIKNSKLIIDTRGYFLRNINEKIFSI